MSFIVLFCRVPMKVFRATPAAQKKFHFSLAIPKRFAIVTRSEGNQSRAKPKNKMKNLETKIANLATKMKDVSHGGWVDCMDLLGSLRGEAEGPTGNALEKVNESEAAKQYAELVSQYEESASE